MQQPNIDRINAQINELEKIKAQIQQPQPSINQTFQLAPNRETMRFAETIEEVKREMVVGDTPYFSKDMSVVWIKNAKGDIKTYEMQEIIEKDEKDLQIEYLQLQIENLRKEINNAKSTNKYTDESSENETTTSISIPRTSTKKSK